MAESEPHRNLSAKRRPAVRMGLYLILAGLSYQSDEALIALFAPEDESVGAMMGGMGDILLIKLGTLMATAAWLSGALVSLLAWVRRRRSA